MHWESISHTAFQLIRTSYTNDDGNDDNDDDDSGVVRARVVEKSVKDGSHHTHTQKYGNGMMESIQECFFFFILLNPSATTHPSTQSSFFEFLGGTGGLCAIENSAQHSLAHMVSLHII